MTTASLAVAETVENEIPHPVVPYVETNPVSVIQSEAIRTRFFAEIEETVSSFQPDLETDKGRKEVASLAYKIARTKTAIDDAGKALNDEHRKKINAVDAVRRQARQTLDKLRDEARAPLDDWERQEEERQAKIQQTRDFLDRAHLIAVNDTSESVAARIADVEQVPDDDVFAEAKAAALASLRETYQRLLKEEADRAELERLRAEQEERRQQEAAEQARREEVERKERERQAEQKRIEEVRQQAAAEAEAKAQAEIDRLNAEKQENERREAERAAEAKRQADEEAKRQRNRAHRSRVMGEAKVALMDYCSLNEQTAKAVVKAIAQDRIQNISIQF